MDREKKTTTSSESTTPKNNIGAYKRSLSVSEPKTETKINNQPKILKEQVKKLFNDGKCDFLTVSVLPRGASYPQLPYIGIINNCVQNETNCLFSSNSKARLVLVSEPSGNWNSSSGDFHDLLS